MKRTKEDARITKETLINTAFSEFLETGYEEARLEDIAAKAGVTRGALYWHFKDKKDLLESIIEFKDTESVEICREMLKSDKPPLDNLKKIISLNFPVIASKRKEENFVRMKVELYNFTIKNGDKKNVAGTITDTIHALLKKMKADKIIKDEVNIRQASYTILFLISGSYIRYNSLPENIRNLKTLNTYVMNYLKLILK